MSGVRPAMLFVLLAVAAAGDDRPGLRCPGTSINRPPALLTKLDALKQTVRDSDFKGRFIARITITDTGAVIDPKIVNPEKLKAVSAILDRLLELRFCPAVIGNEYKTTPLTMHIEIRAEQ